MARTTAATTEVSKKELAAYASSLTKYAKEVKEAIATMDQNELESVYVLAWKSAEESLRRASAFNTRIIEAKFAIEAGSPQDADTVSSRSRAKKKKGRR